MSRETSLEREAPEQEQEGQPCRSATRTYLARTFLLSGVWIVWKMEIKVENRMEGITAARSSSSSGVGVGVDGDAGPVMLGKMKGGGVMAVVRLPVSSACNQPHLPTGRRRRERHANVPVDVAASP